MIMAVVAAANFGVKISSGFRIRSISIPRVYRSKVAFCLKGKDFSSSVPLRYIPKKSSKSKELGKVESLKALKNNECFTSLDSSGLRNAAACSSSNPDRYRANEPEDCQFSKDSRRKELNELKGGEFSSSLPIRNASEKPSEAKESENSRLLESSRGNESFDSLDSNELKGGRFRNASEKPSEANGSEKSRLLKSSRGNESCDSLDSNELKSGSLPIRNAPEKSLKVVTSLRRDDSRSSLDLSTFGIKVVNNETGVGKRIALVETTQRGNRARKKNMSRGGAKQEEEIVDDPCNSLKGGDISSSLPIRDVPPEKPLKSNGSVKSQPLRSLRKNEPRSSLELSAFDTRGLNRARETNTTHGGAKQEIVDDLAVMGDETMEEPSDIVEEIRINKRDAEKEMQDAEKYAVKLLASRAFTAVELRKKLQGKKFPQNIAEEVILDFQTRGLINDGLYAETYSQSRFSSSSWGPRRIKQGLFQKGISGRAADKAVRTVFEEGKPNNDSESNLGMSKLSMDHLLVQASKQWLRGLNTPKETRKSRIIRWLQYRGFSWGVIGLVLKKLESQHPTK